MRRAIYFRLDVVLDQMCDCEIIAGAAYRLLLCTREKQLLRRYDGVSPDT